MTWTPYHAEPLLVWIVNLPLKNHLYSISAIRDKTWERINRVALKDASSAKIENGRIVLVDSTASESNIHELRYRSRLNDSVRVMGRLLENCKSTWGFTKYHNHTKPAKQLARKIIYAKKASQKESHYQKLVLLTKDNLKSLSKARHNLAISCIDGPDYGAWCAEVSYFRSLIEGVINQTQRRVFDGEKVPASEKSVTFI